MTRERTYMLCVGLCLVGIALCDNGGRSIDPHTPAVASPSVEQAATPPAVPDGDDLHTGDDSSAADSPDTESKAGSEAGAAIYIYTDTSFCVPCRKLKARLDAVRKETSAAGWKWVENDDPAKGHIRVFTKIDWDEPYLGKRAIPCAVAVRGGKVIREWEYGDREPFDTELIRWLAYGETPGKTASVGQDQLSRLRKALTHFRQTGGRTCGVQGDSIISHLCENHHGWPRSLVLKLSASERMWLHGADHEGKLKPSMFKGK